MTVTEEFIDKTDMPQKGNPNKGMIRFSVTDPKFYDVYLSARTIVDLLSGY